MKKYYLAFATIIFSLLFTAQTEPDQDMKVEFREISKMFMSELKSVLLKNLKEGGAPQAINVCSDIAIALTNAIGEETNTKIKRATFQPRNRNNTPDMFEEKVLLNFQEKFDAGTLTNEDDYLEVLKIDSSYYARYMTPLFVQGPCLSCHGDMNNLSDDVKKLLKEKYPDDAAIGYKAGDLRGAISITKKLD